MKLAQSNKTEKWTMKDLKEVLKHLVNDKSRDPEGYANEIFKDEAAGSDLLEALLKLMNIIKAKQRYPLVLEKCNITSIHKKKIKKISLETIGAFSECKFSGVFWIASYTTTRTIR